MAKRVKSALQNGLISVDSSEAVIGKVESDKPLTRKTAIIEGANSIKLLGYTIDTDQCKLFRKGELKLKVMPRFVEGFKVTADKYAAEGKTEIAEIIRKFI